MRLDVYNSFKLLGYTINEMSNGDFCGKRPNGKIGIFDSNGGLIKGNLDNIKKVSSELYGGYEESKVKLFNRQGNTIYEHTNPYDMATLRTVNVRENYVKLSHNARDNFNVYSLDGKIRFKGIKDNIYELINDNGDYKLVCSEHRHGKDTTFIKIVDGNNDTEITDINTHDYIESNNHYILETLHSNGNYQVRDFKGNIIYEGSRVIIDCKLLDNDTIIGVSNDCLKITSQLQKIDNIYKSHESIIRAEFTYNKDIISVKDDTGMYLLNIKNMQRTKYFQHIKYFINDIIVAQESYHGSVIGKVDLETFQVDKQLECDRCDLDYNNKEFLIESKDKKSYYNFDLQSLIHEFD